MFNKNLSFSVLCLCAVTALLPTVATSKVVWREACAPTLTATVVIQVVYTSSGVFCATDSHHHQHIHLDIRRPIFHACWVRVRFRFRRRQRRRSAGSMWDYHTV